MNEEKISVVVPIYNIDQYVGLCIESLMRQTYRNLEIILVDDGSTDRSPAICDLYASKDDRIKVIHKPNGGLVSARKAGVAVASGTYIGHVDGDDWVEADYYETLHRAAQRSKADIVCAGFSKDLFSQQFKRVNSVLDGLYEGESLEKLYEHMLTYDHNFTIGVTTYVWNKLFRAEIAKNIQQRIDNRISLGEDAAVTYAALLEASRVYICDNSSYHYRQREGSMLRFYASIDSELQKIRYMYQFMKQEYTQDSRHEMLLNQLDDFTLGYFIMRSGGLLPSGEKTVFGEGFKQKRVVIVRAGYFGQAIFHRLTQRNYCEVVGWYDQNYWEYRRCCMNVDPVADIAYNDFDYALIAKTNQEDIDNTVRELLSFGIESSKILHIDCASLDRGRLLREYLDI